MVERNILAIRTFTLSTSAQKISMKEGECQRVRFPSQEIYLSLLPFGNFMEKTNGVVVQRKPEIIRRKMEGQPEQVLVLGKLEPPAPKSIIERTSEIVLPTIEESIEINPPAVEELSIVESYVCENCGNTMVQSGEVNSPGVHIYSYVCPICSTTKDVVGEVVEPIVEEVKPIVREFICDICGKIYKSAGGLKAHRIMKHKKE